MLSVALSPPLAEDCASKKKYLETFVSHKRRRGGGGVEGKKTLILPTGVRDGDRDRPRLSPAAPIGWHFVQNPTPSSALATHQQILKAYMQPPPSLRRCRTAPQPGAQPRSTLIRAAATVPVKTAPCVPHPAWFCLISAAGTPFFCADFYCFSRRKASTQRTLRSSTSW